MNIKTAYIMGCAGKQLEHLENSGEPAVITIADIQKVIFQDPNIEKLLPAEEIEDALNFAVDISFLEMEGNTDGVVYKRFIPPQVIKKAVKAEIRMKSRDRRYHH